MDSLMKGGQENTMPKKFRTPAERMIPVSFALEVNIRSQLFQMAEEQGVNVSTFVRELIHQALAQDVSQDVSTENVVASPKRRARRASASAVSASAVA